MEFFEGDKSMFHKKSRIQMIVSFVKTSN